MLKFLKSIKKLGWLALVPVLTGCGGGGGGLALLGLGSLFSGGSSVSTFFGSSEFTTLALIDSGGGGIPTVHNPEPTTMLLLGTGMAAMAYLKRKR